MPNQLKNSNATIDVEREIKKVKESFISRDASNLDQLNNFYKEMKEKKIAKDPTFDLPIINSFNINNL